MTFHRLPAYSLFDAILTAAGLPIYIYAPPYYAETYGVSLTGIAAVLFWLRLFDAVQESMVLEQLQSGIGSTAFITSAELDYIVKLNDQKRVVSYATLEAAPLKQSITLSDDEISAFFEMNKLQYRTEEKVKVNYIVVAMDDFADDALGQARRKSTSFVDDFMNDMANAKGGGQIFDMSNSLFMQMKRYVRLNAFLYF